MQRMRNNNLEIRILHLEQCDRRKYPYPPHGESLEIPQEEGALKGNWQPKMEFPGGRRGGGSRVQTNNPPRGIMDALVQDSEPFV